MRAQGEALLVARQVAALRGAGWSTLDALELVAGQLGDAPLQSRLREVLAALRSGGAPVQQDFLLATLSRGDAADAASLGQLADALETEQAAQAAARLRLTSVGVILLAGSLALTVGAQAIAFVAAQLGFASFGATLPAPTQLLLDVLPYLKRVGPLGLLASAAFLLTWRPSRTRGVRRLEAAAALRQFASAVRSGLGEPDALRLLDPAAPSLARSRLGLDVVERALLEHLAARGGTGPAAEVLAAEIEREVRGEAVGLSGLLLVVVIGVAVFVSFVMLALYLPIFSIAGAIK